MHEAAALRFAAVRAGSSDQPDVAAAHTDATVSGGSAGQLELATLSHETETEANSSRTPAESPAGAASVIVADVGAAQTSTPKRRVSFAKKGGDAVIQIHADGTAGAAQPLLGGIESANSSTGAANMRSSSSPDSGSTASIPVNAADSSQHARPSLRSGRKKTHLTIKSNAVVPMPRRRALSEEPPSRSVSRLLARPVDAVSAPS